MPACGILQENAISVFKPVPSIPHCTHLHSWCSVLTRPPLPRISDPVSALLCSSLPPCHPQEENSSALKPGAGTGGKQHRATRGMWEMASWRLPWQQLDLLHPSHPASLLIALKQQKKITVAGNQRTLFLHRITWPVSMIPNANPWHPCCWYNNFVTPPCTWSAKKGLVCLPLMGRAFSAPLL